MVARWARPLLSALMVLLFTVAGSEFRADAQVPPSASDLAGYRGLHAAAAKGDISTMRRLLAAKANPNAKDTNGRTALHVAAHRGDVVGLRLLMRGGAQPNALDNQRYDVITIAAVRDDVATIRAAVAGGGKASNVTSPYDGTALIAASHLGNVNAVNALITAKAPLDHINNLGWTALLEAVILGDGGPRHIEVVRVLVAAGADRTIADRSGVPPIEHARRRGYADIVSLL